MTKIKMIRRSALFMCFLVLFFCLVPGFQQPAHAIAGVDDLAWVLLATLAAYGISVTAIAGFQEVGPWIEEQFEEFVDSLQENVTTVWGKIKYGVTKAGEFVLNAFGLRYSARFGEWLVSKFSLSDNSSVSVQVTPSGYYIDGVGELMLSHTTGGYVTALGTLFDYDRVYTCNGVSFFATYLFNSSSTVLTFFRNGVIYDQVTYSSSWSDVNKYIFAESNTDPGYVFVGNYRPNGYMGVYVQNPISLVDLFSSSSITLTSGSISVPGASDYDDSDGLLVDGIGSWGDPLDRIKTKIKDSALPDSYSLSPDYSITGENTLVIQIVETPVEYGSPENYQSGGLADVFPFCIPFDVYHFFEALAAEPVAPHFEIPFVVEGLVDYTFVIDLSDFEPVVQVLRIMELLLFCVGLALVTRNLIRG